MKQHAAQCLKPNGYIECIIWPFCWKMQLLDSLTSIQHGVTPDADLSSFLNVSEVTMTDTTNYFLNPSSLFQSPQEVEVVFLHVCYTCRWKHTQSIKLFTNNKGRCRGLYEISMLQHIIIHLGIHWKLPDYPVVEIPVLFSVKLN